MGGKERHKLVRDDVKKLFLRKQKNKKKKKEVKKIKNNVFRTNQLISFTN